MLTSHAVHCTIPPLIKRLALMHLRPLSSFWGEAQCISFLSLSAT
jgi:hypothetical protein